MSPPPPVAELPITGYLDRFSHRPGERFEARISVRDGGQARARLVRVISGDPNPVGPGLRFEDLSHRFDVTFDGRHQPIRLGSHAVVPRTPRREPGPLTWTALVWLAVLPAEQAVILCEVADGVSATLAIGRDGVTGIVTAEGRAVVVATGRPPALRGWHRLWLSADPGTGRVAVGMAPLDGTAAVVATAVVPGLRVPARGGRITIVRRMGVLLRGTMPGGRR